MDGNWNKVAFPPLLLRRGRVRAGPSPIVIAGLLALLCLEGCASTAGGPPFAVVQRPTSTPEGTTAIYRTAWSRLEDDIPRAAERCEWGMLFLRETDPGRELEAGAILPQERRAAIHASADADDADHIHLRVKIGLQGDTRAERQFLDQFARVLRGKALKKRGGKFEMP